MIGRTGGGCITLSGQEGRDPGRYHVSMRAPSNLANTPKLGKIPSIHVA